MSIKDQSEDESGIDVAGGSGLAKIRCGVAGIFQRMTWKQDFQTFE
jgi:hypothetical protein